MDMDNPQVFLDIPRPIPVKYSYHSGGMGIAMGWPCLTQGLTVTHTHGGYTVGLPLNAYNILLLEK